MARYECKGIIVFPHLKVLKVYMAKLRMVYGEELYTNACHALVTVRKFTAGELEVPIPIMILDREGYEHDAKDLAVYRMIQAAEDLDLLYKYYLQETTIHNDHNIYGGYKQYGSVTSLLNAVGEEDPANTMDESIVVSCMRACIEDTAMEMRVWVTTNDGDSWDMSGDAFPYDFTVKESITNVNKEESL